MDAQDVQDRVCEGRGRFTNRPYGLMAFRMSAMACAAKRMPSMTMVKDAAPTIHRMSDGINRDRQDVQDGGWLLFTL